MKSPFFRRAGALLLTLALVCSLVTLPAKAADPTPDPPGPVPVTGISLDQTALTMETNDTVTLTATVEPEDATDKTVTWQSVNRNVATVNNGVVTAVGTGNTRILAMAGGRTATCDVTVLDVPVTGIQLDPFVYMEVGTTTLLRPTFTPENASDKRFQIRQTGGDAGALEIQSDGTLRGLKPGTVHLTVTSNSNPGVNASCTVYVIDAPVDRVTLNRETANLTAGERLELTATVYPDNVQNREVEWSDPPAGAPFTIRKNGNRATVIVNNNAEPTGSTGGYTVYATSKADPGKSALCVIRIVGPRPSEVTGVQIVSPNTDDFKYVDPGKTLSLEARAIPSDAPEADREILWSSSDTSIATVDTNTGTITGVAPGKTIITAAAAADGTIRAYREIEVSGILLSYLKRSTTGGKGTTVKLSESDTVEIFQYRDINVTAETFGFAKGKAITWESTNNTVASVVNGRVAANYPGDNVTISASVAGTGYRAGFKVRVTEDVAQAITVNMGSSATYSFSGLVGTLNSRSQSKAGAALESVYNLKVSTDDGTLFYKYVSGSTPNHGVGGSESYYYQPSSQSQMAIRDITFVPTPGFSGTAVVDYNARATNGNTFTGTIRIEATASGDVSYSTDAGQPVTFSAEHFSAVCKGRNNQAIRYVSFDQPASNRGILYQDYMPDGTFSPKVSSGTRYYVSAKPSIDQVTFVPAEGFSGDVPITYHCTDSAGGTYTGTVTVRVGPASGAQSGNVVYSTSVNQQRTLNASDFNDASLRVTGGGLHYIRFNSLPSSSAGRLYLNYVSSSNTGSQVSTGRNYYRSTSPRISSITFVPASNYNGTVTIPYTGTTSSGTTFSGNLIINVGRTNDGTTVRYTVSRGQAVGFSAYDFNNACRYATGQTLNYIRFTSLPSSTYGTLRYQYNYGTGAGNAVSTGTSYYYSNSARLLNDVTFAASNTSGVASFGYTGYGAQGTSFSGRVEVEVTGGGSVPSNASSHIYYTGSSTPISFRAVDFQNACQAALGTTLASVQFSTLPASGRLYQNYSGPGRPGSSVSAATRYGTQELDQITYLPRAEYQGTITIPYTAHDIQGGTHSGTVELQISNSNSYASFSDLGGMDWARPSIEFLRQSGITNGYGNNTFRPRQAISRGEFTLMICRAFQFPTTGFSGFPDVPDSSTYAGAVASARNLGIVQGNNGRFQPDRPISRQSAMAMISRAMDAAGRTLPSASTGILSNYTDGGSVSAFARPAVAALIQSGAVRGTSDMRINPTAPISRAEMAVILHRVLTL